MRLSASSRFTKSGQEPESLEYALLPGAPEAPSTPMARLAHCAVPRPRQPTHCQAITSTRPAAGHRAAISADGMPGVESGGRALALREGARAGQRAYAVDRRLGRASLLVSRLTVFQ